MSWALSLYFSSPCFVSQCCHVVVWVTSCFILIVSCVMFGFASCVCLSLWSLLSSLVSSFSSLPEFLHFCILLSFLNVAALKLRVYTFVLLLSSYPAVAWLRQLVLIRSLIQKRERVRFCSLAPHYFQSQTQTESKADDLNRDSGSDGPRSRLRSTAQRRWRSRE